MGCPNCGKKIKKKSLESDHCIKCGYEFNVGDFLNWDEMKFTKFLLLLEENDLPVEDAKDLSEMYKSVEVYYSYKPDKPDITNLFKLVVSEHNLMIKPDQLDLLMNKFDAKEKGVSLVMEVHIKKDGTIWLEPSYNSSTLEEIFRHLGGTL